MLNAVYVSGNAPEAFRRAAIVPIPPKKGDLSQLGNWRGISLMSLLAKLYNCPVLDPLLRKNQNGFRPGRGCPEHSLCLRRLIEGFVVKGGGGVGVLLISGKRSTAWSCRRAKLAKCAVDKATTSHTSNNCCVILAAQLSTNFNRR